MKPLYTEQELKQAKELTKLPFKCENCDDIFYKTKIDIRNILSPNRHDTGDCCSPKCAGEYKRKRVKVNCLVCNKELEKFPSQLKIYPKSFCGKSCASKYANAHKTTGSNRSKLEIWLESELTRLYPKVEILYNNVSVINAELDIYIPNLKLAFEINGIFHYEPIFGKDKLSKTQTNDKRKIQACIDNGIGFCIIDSTELKYFKPERVKKYLDIITTIINETISMKSSQFVD